MRISHAEAERYRLRIADLARLGRAAPDDHRPTPEEAEDDFVAWLHRCAATLRPRPVSTLTGRPTPPASEAYLAAGPLPEDPAEFGVELRRRLKLDRQDRHSGPGVAADD